MGIEVFMNKNFFIGVVVGVAGVWAWHAFVAPRARNGK